MKILLFKIKSIPIRFQHDPKFHHLRFLGFGCKINWADDVAIYDLVIFNRPRFTFGYGEK